MEFYQIAIVVLAPAVGWVFATLFPMSRADATPEERRHDVARNIVPVVIWLPLAFMFPAGAMRWTSLLATVLLYAAVFVAGRRAIR